jgi:hypothetical protein
MHRATARQQHVPCARALQAAAQHCTSRHPAATQPPPSRHPAATQPPPSRPRTSCDSGCAAMPASVEASGPAGSQCTTARVTCVPPTAHTPATSVSLPPAEAGGAPCCSALPRAMLVLSAGSSLAPDARAAKGDGACSPLSTPALPALARLARRLPPSGDASLSAAAPGGVSWASGSVAAAHCCHARARGQRGSSCPCGVRGVPGSSLARPLATNSRSCTTCCVSVFLGCVSVRARIGGAE